MLDGTLCPVDLLASTICYLLLPLLLVLLLLLLLLFHTSVYEVFCEVMTIMIFPCNSDAMMEK